MFLKLQKRDFKKQTKKSTTTKLICCRMIVQILSTISEILPAVYSIYYIMDFRNNILPYNLQTISLVDVRQGCKRAPKLLDLLIF